VALQRFGRHTAKWMVYSGDGLHRGAWKRRRPAGDLLRSYSGLFTFRKQRASEI
jgi:hypothetical protein